MPSITANAWEVRHRGRMRVRVASPDAASAAFALAFRSLTGGRVDGGAPQRGRIPIVPLALLALMLVLAACTASPAERSVQPRTERAGDEVPAGWRTDFALLAPGVRLDEFVRAAAGRDAIPALDDPAVTSVASADWIGETEPVIAVAAAGEWRAYPLQILLWHEIANDTLGGEPIAVTFCPLCYTSVVFDRRYAGSVLDFGVTGYLRRSDLVMYDRQTETWWQQATGVGLAGRHAGEHLTILASSIVAWRDFVAAHPDATVLDRATGFDRPYGRNPYPGWDRMDRNPFLGGAQLEPCEGADGCLDPKERVAVLTVNGRTVVYRFRTVVEAGGLIHDEVGPTLVVVWWLPQVSSVLDNELIERSDQVGSIVAFDRRHDGDVLTFALRDGQLYDAGTGTRWDSLGRATAGPAVGAQLRRLHIDTPYWFGFAAFGAGYEIWRPMDPAPAPPR